MGKVAQQQSSGAAFAQTSTRPVSLRQSSILSSMTPEFGGYSVAETRESQVILTTLKLKLTSSFHVGWSKSRKTSTLHPGVSRRILCL
jgi:hypothetical protein